MLSRCATSLCRKIFFSAPERRTPSIIDAWFSSSEMIRQLGSKRPMVEIDASLETKPEVKTRAASLPCRSASSSSSSTSGMVGAGNIARAAGARTHPAGGLLQGGDDVGVLAHAEIVVGAPDGDFLGLAVGAPDRAGKGSGDALEIGEYAVATLGMDLVDGFFEEPLIVHVCPSGLRRIIVAGPLCVHCASGVKMPRPNRFPINTVRVSIPLIRIKRSDQAEAREGNRVMPQSRF